MGGGGKGGQTSGGEQTVTTQPWPGQSPYLSNLYESATSLPTQQPYPFPGFVPYSPSTAQAMQMQSQRALTGSPVQAAGQLENLATTTGQYLGAQPGVGYLQPGMSGQYLNVGQYPGAQQMGRISQQGLPLGGQALAPLTGSAYGQYMGSAPGGEYQRRTAEGDYLTGGPGFEAAFEAARRRITPAVQGSFARAGRYGGGLAQEAETGALADAFAGLYGQERERQEAAARSLDASHMAERGLMAGAAGQLGGLYGSNVGQQLQASGMLSGLYGGERGLQQQASQQAAQLASGQYGQERERMLRGSLAAPSMAQADYADIAQLGSVGAAQEAKAGQALSDAIARWNMQQQAPYTRVGAMTPPIAGSMPGQTTQTQSDIPTNINPYGAALGGALAGYGLGGPAGITGIGLSPLGGAGIGAGLGLLGAMK